jgi:hypothetical protein
VDFKALLKNQPATRDCAIQVVRQKNFGALLSQTYWIAKQGEKFKKSDALESDYVKLNSFKNPSKILNVLHATCSLN